MEQLTVNYDVYEDANRYDGTASAVLPDISFLTQSMSGAGIGGNIEAVTAHIDAMTLSLNWREHTNEAYGLSTPKRHHIELRAARQDENPVTGELEYKNIKRVLVVIPKGLTGGTLAPHSATSPASSFAVRYYAVYIEGVKQIELDPLNYICYINGTDYLENVRKALGR